MEYEPRRIIPLHDDYDVQIAKEMDKPIIYIREGGRRFIEMDLGTFSVLTDTVDALIGNPGAKREIHGREIRVEEVGRNYKHYHHASGTVAFVDDVPIHPDDMIAARDHAEEL